GTKTCSRIVHTIFPASATPCDYNLSMMRLGVGLVSIWIATAMLRAAAPSSALELARQLNTAFIEVAENVSPAVVVIRVAQREHEVDFDEENPFWEMVPKE